MTHAEGADTLIGVLQEASSAGFDANFVVEPGATISCPVCETQSSASQLDIANYRRLEGASDAADLMLVVLTTCPSCGARGAITVGYGPNAGENDAELLAALDLREVEPGPIG